MSKVAWKASATRRMILIDALDGNVVYRIASIIRVIRVLQLTTVLTLMNLH